MTVDTAGLLVVDVTPLAGALKAISSNKRRIVFVVDSDGVLVGSMTDGDFRRWLVTHPSASLQAPCRAAARPDCVRVGVEEDPTSLSVSQDIDLIPVVDQRNRVVSILSRRSRDFTIDGHEVTSTSPVLVIAEIGINHNGEFEQALRLVDAALEAQADCVKLQLRDLDHLYRASNAGRHGEDLGAQYTLDLLDDVSLTTDETLKVLEYVRESGAIPLCTPWDLESARVLKEWGIPALKIASADLTNEPLLSSLTSWGIPLIASTGMSTEADVRGAIRTLERGKSPYALLHCNSAYPAPFKDIQLRYMSRLAELSGTHVGYSGHERGHHVVLGAISLGARIIEKHLTLDRNARGIDHKVSLEPREFGTMVTQIRELECALGAPLPRRVTQGEALNRLALAKSVVAKTDLPLGQVLTEKDLDIKSPGRGLQPNRMHELVGAILQRPMKAGDFFFETDVEESLSQPRNYSFRRPWGLPVRFHDWESLVQGTNPDFLEFHLSYRDLDVDIDSAFNGPIPVGLVVHSPDLFADDLILDLASEDESLRARSVTELQRVVDFTERLRPYFMKHGKTLLVASLGGSTLDRPLLESERPRRYELVLDSLEQLELKNVQLVAQTLPPFPWYMGGQRYCNLFVEPGELIAFARASGLPICLDLAHTKLACSHLKQNFIGAIEILLPHVCHLHVVDAGGVDDEGLQISEGDIEWEEVVTVLKRLPRSVGFIPEIWQGHVDGGRGFWTALERLEKFAL